jgi:hypothetical protein
MTLVNVDGKDYEIENPLVVVDGKQFHTGLWIPHHRDEVQAPVMSAVGTAGIRDLEDVREIVEFNRWIPSVKRYPPSIWTRSQGAVGSCAGYAAAWALARARVSAGHAFVPLSGESVYSQVNGGRDRGSALAHCIKAIVDVGVAPEGLNMAGKFYTERTLPEAAKAERHRFKAAEWHEVSSELELAIAIAAGYTVGVAIHVGRNWGRMNGDMLVPDRGPGNHAVLVDDVRFAGNKPQFHMVNSHGLRWGHEGCAWTDWSHYSPTIRNHVFYAIRSVHADPLADNPPALAA